jgi:glycosyltransferase involved in cell wall biosynthesis
VIVAERRPAEAMRSGGEWIGFLSAQSPRDPRVCLGINEAMMRALERQGDDVVWLGPAPAMSLAVGRTFDFALRCIAGKRYDFRRSPLAVAEYGARFGAPVRKLRPDWIVASYASAKLAGLASDIPVVYCAEATYRLVRGYYGTFCGYVDEGDGERAEALAVAKASLCVYPSRWAADSAIRDYGVDPSRVAVIPFGANLGVPERGELRSRQLDGALHLLFVGSDWEREGGTIAYETFLRMQTLGISATLTVAGCEPPSRFKHPALTVIPFLDKRTEEGRWFYRELYLRSHLVLLPSREQTFGVTVYEANGHGVPAVVAETGGLAEAVIDGVNGLRLPLSARCDDFAAAIAALYADPARYSQLARSSREIYERHGNWDAWATELRRRVAETLAAPARPKALGA